MFRFKKIPERESAKEVLERLKSEEKGVVSRAASLNTGPNGITYLNIGQKKQVPTAEKSTIPEYNVDQIIRQIISLERKMREDSSNYLNLYHDLRKLEDKFLKAVEFLRVNNIQVKPEILKEITAREGVISRRGKRSV
mgnify:CR=1 FL=1